MSRKLDQYTADHSTPEDLILEDLYRQTHIRFVNPNMASGHIQGLFLEMLSKMIKPENILEIGTYTGYSAICLAKGLKKEGKLITIEINDELSEFAHDYFRMAGAEKSIVQMTGNAIEIIPGINKMFDLVYIDGDKREYVDYYKVVFDKVKPGGFIIADNVLWGGKVTERETTDPQATGVIAFNDMIRNDKRIENVIIPLRDGLMLIRKKSLM
jgi:caffeoyl-CoA O-methyltransferase